MAYREKEQAKIGQDLTEGSILKGLLAFAVPMLLSNLVQQLYSMVDLAVIGQFVGSNGTVGVSTGGSIADMSTMLVTSLAMAGQVYIAQLAGAKDMARIRETVGTLLTMLLIVALVMMTAIFTLSAPILHLMNCPEEAFADATLYMRITALGLPFICGYNGLCCVLRGMGESKRPLYFILVAASINVVLDVLLVAVIKWGAAGTAIATVLSQAGAFGAAFWFLCRHKEQFGFELRLSYFRVRWAPLRIILTLGIPNLVSSICVQGTLQWCSAGINSYGLVASATNGIGNKLQTILNVFTMSLNNGAAGVIGQNIGARKHDRVTKTVRTTLACAMTVFVLSALVCLFLPRTLFRLFTQDEAVIEYGVLYMRILILTCFAAAVQGSFQGVITGSGFAALNFVLGLMDGVVFRVGFSLLFLHVFNAGAASYFFGNAFARYAPAVIGIVYFLSGAWKRRKLLSETAGA